MFPCEDLVSIARIDQDLREYYDPSTSIGLAMADHAASLIVRLDRCGRHEVALVDDQIAGVKYDFDHARRDWADELFDGLRENPASVGEVKQFPEGIDRLIEGWSSLDCVDDWSGDERAMAMALSDSGCADLSALRGSIPQRITQLAVAKEAIDLRPIDRARQHAADLALFGMSPEAILARRYEAATVRALEKARKYLEDVALAEEQAPETSQTPEAIDPAALLGSLLPGQAPRAGAEVMTRPGPPAVDPVAPKPPAERSKRPDPQKLRATMDRKRR